MTGPYDLPEGWHWARFGDIARVASNLVSPSDYPNHPHLAPNHIIPETGQHEALATVTEDGVTSSKHLFEPGQLIYSKIRPYLRKATIAKMQGLCSADMYPIETELDTRYLMWWMLSGEFTALAMKGRSVIPKINQAELKAIPVPVPPPREQQAIVEAVERAVSLLDAARQHVVEAAAVSLLLQASVLDRAVDGRLVGHVPAQGDPWPIPSSWRWATVADVADVRGGIQKQPSRKPRRNTAPFLRVANVQRDELVLDDVHQIELFDGELARYRLEPGDLLVVEGNGSLAHIGRSAVWDGSIEDCVHQNHLIRVRPGPHLNPRWLNYYWNSPRAARIIRDAAKTTSGLYTLSAGKVASIAVPVPPLDEQAALVDRAEAQLSLADHARAQATTAAERSHALRRSLLKAAFDGRLTSGGAPVAAEEPREEVA